ncbi:hypothetical protein STEG23_024870, partial [Scotinomys teguina]
MTLKTFSVSGKLRSALPLMFPVTCRWLLEKKPDTRHVDLFDSSTEWTVEHPQTLFAWKGACIWIPCKYQVPGSRTGLDKVFLFHNYEFDNHTKDFNGTVLYNSTKIESPPSEHGRVTFWGDRKNNCSLEIRQIQVSDRGKLGLRMISGNDKWMEALNLNISETPFPPSIQLPSEIRESQSVTLTCRLNFACSGYHINLKWSLEEPQSEITHSTSATVKNVYTESKLTFRPEWTDHGKSVMCQVWRGTSKLSEDTVRLDVKHVPQLMIKDNPRVVRKGESVTMTCQVTSSNPEYLSVSWVKDGQPLQEQTLTLTLQAVTKDMSGKYRCQASNDLGLGQSEEVVLTVQYVPKVVTTVIQNPTPIREGDTVTLACSYNSSNPEVVNYHWGPQDAPRAVKVLKVSPSSKIHAGQRVLLQCNFSGSNPTEVRIWWKKNGSLVQEGKDLSFSSISPEDSGKYNCMVSNSIGETLSEAWDLQVLYAPRRLRVSISPGDSIMEGKKATLSCESDANPPVSQYVWLDSSNQDLHFFGQKLRLEPLRVQHTGSYRCRGINQLGMSESPPSTLTVYSSSSACWVILTDPHKPLILRWKQNQSQQGLQENSSGQSFFVRNKKTRRTPLSEGPQPQGCYNPAMDDNVSYAILRFPETDTPRAGDAETSAAQGPSPNNDDTVTYSVLQKHHVSLQDQRLPPLWNLLSLPVTPSCYLHPKRWYYGGDSLGLRGLLDSVRALWLSSGRFLLWALASSEVLRLTSGALSSRNTSVGFKLLSSADELSSVSRSGGSGQHPPDPMALPPQLSFALYVSAFALGFPLNLMAIRGTVAHARLRLTPSLVYTLHLGCSDLLLAVTLPLKAVEALASGAWPLPLPICPIFALVHFAPLYAGGGFLAALSAGRYLGAAFPFGYQAIRRPRYSWGVCVAIWALVLCHLGLVLGLEAPGGWLDNTTSSLGISIPVNGSPVCLEAWDPNSAGPARLSFSILLFFVPLGITAFCYVGCLRALVHSASVAMGVSFSLGNHWLFFSVYLMVFLVGLPLNVMALVVFVGKLRRHPVAVDLLLLNLTLSDLLLLLFLPFRMVEAASGMRWLLPFIFCPLSGFLFFTTIYLTSLFLMAVSIERFLSVAYPLWYKTRPRLAQAGLVSGICWFLASAHCSVVYVTEYWGNATHSQGTDGTCYLEFREDQLAVLLPVRLEMAVVLFMVPLCITSYCYSRLVWILSQGASRRRRKRVMGLLAATLLIFFVCFGPYNMSHVVGYVRGESPTWRSYVLLLSTLNSCIDPLVFYFSSSKFQAEFQQLLGRLTRGCVPWTQEVSLELKRGCHHVAQTGLELLILLPQLPECSDDRPTLLHRNQIVTEIPVKLPTEAPGKDTVQPTELPAGCAVNSRFPAVRAVTHALVGFGDAAVCELFLLRTQQAEDYIESYGDFR